MKLPNRRDAKPVKRQTKTHFKPGQILTAVKIIDLSDDGHGVAKLEGKTLFVDHAVPGDQVTLQISDDLPSYAQAKLVAIEQPSNDRTTPFCAIYEACGGCQLQHLSIAAQRHWKQQHLMLALSKLQPQPSIQWHDTPNTPDRAYRRRAKLILGRDWQDQSPLLGFRSPQSHQLVDVAECPILAKPLNQQLVQQRPQWLAEASARNQTLWLTAGDEQTLTKLGDHSHDATTKDASTQMSCYRLLDLKFYFSVTSFIQVNQAVNEQLVAQTLNWLALTPQTRVIDFFAGIGNFSLPLAQRSAAVLGLEGNAEAVTLAKHNAQANNLRNVEFLMSNLFDEPDQQAWWSWTADSAVLDPGRAGAEALCEKLGKTQLKRVVYVSCHPGTLIRDLRLLIAQGFVIAQAQQFDMFSHTKHIESLILLTRL
ncbi:23S rRNA (uracil(1939)-C(5))-methyltransferase RlmD [Thiomicrospira cyclica]|uniref:RNA methyltransferase, TrmA family n=1 Tax=Thiomicrospira cyclica (strain DSM 14477 / JCM 11371 / ALM1) TaxID=717773 RepID=F6DA68_THICA|nr:23S rRNA (uracil(1939)-C(5))-methyltransferase RlmD [Thiomicrospira cyclica]AEG32199.1 RNA methyltransferase, TrmA family [Thiomicrospira cyclica ALM1]